MPSETEIEQVRDEQGRSQPAASAYDARQTFPNGGAFDSSGGYPVTINPSQDIVEVILTQSGGVEMYIETVGGDSFQFPLNGTVGAFNRWKASKIEFRDPDGTGDSISGAWAGGVPE